MSDDNLMYYCRIATYDPAFASVVLRKLERGHTQNGLIPISENPDWDYPVVKFPFGQPVLGDNVSIVFAREKKLGEESLRNVVRINRLPDAAQGKKPLYRLTYGFFPVPTGERFYIEDQKDLVRFYVHGYAENRNGEERTVFVVAVLKQQQKLKVFAGGEEYEF